MTASPTSLLHHARRGEGPPLVLVHALGGSSVMWNAVFDRLAAGREVVTLDLPGFGRSPALPAGSSYTAPALAAVVGEFCQSIGIERPHVAGVSHGGWVALEIGRAGDAASVAAISPAGLWAKPLGTHRFDPGRRATVLLRHAISIAMLVPRVRAAVLGASVANPARVPVDEAREMVGFYLNAPGYPATSRAMRAGVFERPEEVEVPVTIAWGRRDRLVGRPRPYRMPPQTRYVEPAHWGHVPMWDDPEGVARLLLEASSDSDRPARPG